MNVLSEEKKGGSRSGHDRREAVERRPRKPLHQPSKELSRSAELTAGVCHPDIEWRYCL